ncbi:MAG: hypothetical protein OXK21_05110 [Chloroflexota bacterium]|nr:hypothetical protein [Chloroflexota bacterium]
MIGYRYDDGGRAAAGYRGKTGDCVVRAIAICADDDYRAVYLTMAEHMKSNGYAASGNAYATRERNRKAPRRRGQLTARRVQDRVLEAYGFTKVRLPRGERPSYTEAHRRYGDCIVGTTKHLAAIVDGALRDTFDGRTYEWDVETRERKAQSVWARLQTTQE